MSKTVIDAQRGTIFLVHPNEVQIVGFDTQHQRGDHPLWQARALEAVDEALALSIANDGFLSCIAVRKDGPNLEVVVGRRRVKAARRANEIRAARGELALKIKVEVVRGSDQEMVGRMISENANRKNVPPMDMASDLQAFLNMGASEDTVARSAGKSVPALRKFLRLLDLDLKVQEQIRAGKLSVSAALHLADLTREDQVAALAKLSDGGAKVSGDKVKNRVKAAKEGKEDATGAPGKRLLNRLLADEEAEAVFGPQGLAAIRFVFGELPANDIDGLAELIAKVSSK